MPQQLENLIKELTEGLVERTVRNASDDAPIIFTYRSTLTLEELIEKLKQAYNQGRLDGAITFAERVKLKKKDFKLEHEKDESKPKIGTRKDRGYNQAIDEFSTKSAEVLKEIKGEVK